MAFYVALNCVKNDFSRQALKDAHDTCVFEKDQALQVVAQLRRTLHDRGISDAKSNERTVGLRLAVEAREEEMRVQQERHA